MKKYPTTVIQSVWRRLRRPAPATIAALPAYREPKLPPRISARVISGHEAEKFALQNMALLYVLESHEKSLSILSPSALDLVRQALAPAGQRKSRPNVAA